MILLPTLLTGIFTLFFQSFQISPPLWTYFSIRIDFFHEIVILEGQETSEYIAIFLFTLAKKYSYFMYLSFFLSFGEAKVKTNRDQIKGKFTRLLSFNRIR